MNFNDLLKRLFARKGKGMPDGTVNLESFSLEELAKLLPDNQDIKKALERKRAASVCTVTDPAEIPVPECVKAMGKGAFDVCSSYSFLRDAQMDVDYDKEELRLCGTRIPFGDLIYYECRILGNHWTYHSQDPESDGHLNDWHEDEVMCITGKCKDLGFVPEEDVTPEDGAEYERGTSYYGTEYRIGFRQDGRLGIVESKDRPFEDREKLHELFLRLRKEDGKDIDSDTGSSRGC